MSLGKLYVQDDAGGFKLADDKALIKEAGYAVQRCMAVGTKFRRQEDIKPYLVALLGHRKYETFCAGYIDNAGGLLAFDELFKGNSEMVQIHPRAVVKRAIELDAESLFLVHNHPGPGGAPRPSQPDIDTTASIAMAGAILGIGVIDHYIVASNEVGSLKELGAMRPEVLQRALQRQFADQAK
jgi:DNA repair protein RadC